MPETITFTGEDIKKKTYYLSAFCDKEQLEKCLADADKYVYVASSFKDPGPDYTRHTFYKGSECLGSFYIPGY